MLTNNLAQSALEPQHPCRVAGNCQHNSFEPYRILGRFSGSLYAIADHLGQADVVIEISAPLALSEARALRTELPSELKSLLTTRALRGLRTPVRLGFVCLDSAADAFFSAVEGGKA